MGFVDGLASLCVGDYEYVIEMLFPLSHVSVSVFAWEKRDLCEHLGIKVSSKKL